jgi:hypothetical protein
MVLESASLSDGGLLQSDTQLIMLKGLAFDVGLVIESLAMVRRLA